MSDFDRIMLDKANRMQSNNQPDSDLFNRVYTEKPSADASSRMGLPVQIAVDSLKGVAADYNKGTYNNEAAATTLMRSLGNLSAAELNAAGQRLQKDDPNWKVSKDIDKNKDVVDTFRYTYPNREIGINPVNFIDSTLGYAAHKAKNFLLGPDLEVSFSSKKLAVQSTNLSGFLSSGRIGSYNELNKKSGLSQDIKRNFYVK